MPKGILSYPLSNLSQVEDFLQESKDHDARLDVGFPVSKRSSGRTSKLGSEEATQLLTRLAEPLHAILLEEFAN